MNSPKQDQLENNATGKPPEPAKSTGNNGAVAGMCVLLAAAVFLVFGQTLKHEFVNYDDDHYVYENPEVLKGLTRHGIGWALTFSEIGHWHPLTWSSHMLDVELFGPGPAGPHLTNVLLHAANTVLLFLVLRRMIGFHFNKSIGATDPQEGGRSDKRVGTAVALTGTLWPSAFVAAVFAIHPLRAESVAWVSERKDVLSGFFFMLTLLMYARYVQALIGGERSVGETGSAFTPDSSRVTRLPAEALTKAGQVSLFYGLALLFFALGLLSKNMLVTLPFVLLLLDYWPLQRFRIGDAQSVIWPLFREKFPFFVLSAASCVATSLASEMIPPEIRLPFIFRMESALVSYISYIWQMVYPAGLAIPYPIETSSLLIWKAVVAFLLLAAISLCAFALQTKRPYFAIGWLWYLGMLVPAIGIVQISYYTKADRYTYLPQIGLYLIIVWAVRDLTSSWRYRRPILVVAALSVITALMVCAWKQTSYWHDSGTLFRHTLAVTKNNHIAYYNLGECCFSQGRLEEAIDDYRKAIQIRPRYSDAFNNLGVALAEKGELDEAIARIRESIHYRPDKADAYYNLGNVFIMQHKLDEAAGAYSEALRLKPDYPQAHNNLANVLLMQGHRDAAVQHYQEAVRLNPDHEGAKRQLRALGAQIP